MARPLGQSGDPVEFLAELAAAYSTPADHVARRLAIELDFGAWRNERLAEGLRSSHRAIRENIARALAGSGGDARKRDLAAVAVLVLFLGIAHLDTLDPELLPHPPCPHPPHPRIPPLVACPPRRARA